jgi:beta-lactamase regulating signal transducer with metallopeptidase domain
MNSLFLFAAHNSVVAFILALVLIGVTRFWRNPPVAHLLWLLILLKLVAPPIVPIEWRMPGLSPASRPSERVRGHRAESQGAKVLDPARAAPLGLAVSEPGVPVSHAPPQLVSAAVGVLRKRARPVVLGLWLGIAALLAVVACTRIVRFERLVRGTMPVPERLKEQARAVAAKLGVRQMPDLRALESRHSPFVWCAGLRAIIVLPTQRLADPDDRDLTLMLTHELAHLRRRDHWVRPLELLVSIVYWWNPLVWLVRRQLHQAEDQSCDAWVRWAYPQWTKRYAEVLLETAESMNLLRENARFSRWLASPFVRPFSLKARIEMVLAERFAPGISRQSMLLIALLASLVLPSFVRATRAEPRPGSRDDEPAANSRKSDSPATLEFPHVVRFEQGATRFQTGDKITIQEVRGTAETFAPGNLYWIKGTYTLASHHRASLAAYVTAMDRENGRGATFRVQETTVNEGDGTFTLILPMSYRGWPHVSFYPADGGSDFGGNYFGTGDSVLKKWWGEKK